MVVQNLLLKCVRLLESTLDLFHITWDDLILFQVGYILACHKIKLVHSHLFSQ